MRGATCCGRIIRIVCGDFNPRTPCEVRLRFFMSFLRFVNFNPRTPCEVRRHVISLSARPKSFQSTHPMRGATQLNMCYNIEKMISIHAPHARCDKTREKEKTRTSNFNPRTPCEVRPPQTIDLITLTPFQSTHPMRGATVFAIFIFTA